MSILYDAGYQPHMKQKIIFNGSFIPDFQFLGLSHFFFFPYVKILDQVENLLAANSTIKWSLLFWIHILEHSKTIQL